MVRAMRFSSLFILAFLVGCSGAPDTDSTGSGGGTGSGGEAPGWSDTPGSGSGGPCANATQVVKAPGPDGGTILIVVPIPCNPYWRDTGDPPPDRQREQVVDPGPDDRIIRIEGQQQYER